MTQDRNPARDTNLDPIADWASPLMDSGAYPSHGLLLKFSNATIENCFLRDSYAAQRHSIKLNIALTIVFLLLFAAIDPLLLRAELLKDFRIARFGWLIPLSIISLVCCHFVSDPRRWLHFCGASIVLFGLSWTVLLLAGGTEVLGYLTLAMIQTVVGTFFLLALPIRYSIAAVALYTSVFTIAAFAMQLPLGTALTYTLGNLTVAMVCAFGAFRSERASRRQFVTQALSDAQYRQRLAIQHDRNRWLEMIAAFLRHELKNSMIGVSTSIELASRSHEHHQVSEYLQRATHSLQFMRRLLGQVADATSLEVALVAQESELLNFSELVSGRAQDLRQAEPGWTIDTRVTPEIWVRGNADSLVQMMDKLIDNALEHGDKSHPLTIVLRTDTHAELTIENRGEPLSQDVEELFQPFVSNKTRSSGNVNLGLGLFVARTIAAHHSGSVEATGLTAPPGAAFCIRLPRHAAPDIQRSLGEPAIPASALSCDAVE